MKRLVFCLCLVVTVMVFNSGVTVAASMIKFEKEVHVIALGNDLLFPVLITDDDGKPVPNVSVHSLYSEMYKGELADNETKVITDKNGIAEFTIPPSYEEGSRYVTFWVSDNFVGVKHQMFLYTSDDDMPVQIELVLAEDIEDSGYFFFQVLNVWGYPVADISVSIITDYFFGKKQTNKNGIVSFVIPTKEAGEGQVTVWSSDYAFIKINIDVDWDFLSILPPSPPKG